MPADAEVRARNRKDDLMTVEAYEFRSLLDLLYALYDYDQEPSPKNAGKVMKAYESALEFQFGSENRKKAV